MCADLYTDDCTGRYFWPWRELCDLQAVRREAGRRGKEGQWLLLLRRNLMWCSCDPADAVSSDADPAAAGCNRGYDGVCTAVLPVYGIWCALHHCLADTEQSDPDGGTCRTVDDRDSHRIHCEYYSGSGLYLWFWDGCGRSGDRYGAWKCGYRYFAHLFCENKEP